MKKQKNQSKSTAGSPQTNGLIPPPGFGEVMADFRWTLEQLNAGALEEYEGEFIVVYNQQVVAHDLKYNNAKKKAIQKIAGVPEGRFAISFVDKLE